MTSSRTRTGETKWKDTYEKHLQITKLYASVKFSNYYWIKWCPLEVIPDGVRVSLLEVASVCHGIT